MKKLLLSAMLTTLTLTSLQSFAKDGTVIFDGTITESGCEVTNATDGVITVDMGTYSSSALSTTGQTTGPKPFEVDLQKCAAGAVKLRFDGQSVSGNTNVLALTPDSGDNDPSKSVGIQITDVASNGIYVIGDESGISGQQIADDGSLNIKLAARYYAYADGTPSGVANSATDFSVEYE